MRWGARIVGAALLVGAVVFVAQGANRPPDPSFRRAGAARTPVSGFGSVSYTISRHPAAVRCALLAETEAQRSQGLMGRRDLAGHDGMIFRFPANVAPEVGAFYMKDTPLPLSIAWFDESGAFVSSADMEPCLGRPDCPLYRAARAYRFALEVPKGQLERLGVGEGSQLVVGGPCT